MRKALVLLNTDSLGGAERSLILQLKDQKQLHFSFFIPNVSGSKDLENYICELGFQDVFYYHFPASVYSLSRKGIFSFWKSVWGLFILLFSQNAKIVHTKYDYVYLNGNKAAFYFFASKSFSRFNGKVFWHLRDYWFQNRFTNFVWGQLLKRRNVEIQIVGNSHSTLKSTKGSPLESLNQEVIYNPSGLAPAFKSQRQEIKKIGVVSMLAPWKGIHEVILWASMYESELKRIGIEEISIYGANIYHTSGEHSQYSTQLKSLLSKTNSSLLVFYGQEKPSDIFTSIDVLLHYSLEPEPFGRVLIESFINKVPVISTALGGAGEMVEHLKTGLVVDKYDKNGMFELVKLLVENKKLSDEITNNAFLKAKNIESSVEQNMHRLFEERRSA